MHKHVRTVVIGSSLLALVLVPGLAEKLLAFLFVGLVPFTDYTLDPMVLMGLYALLMALCIYGITRQAARVSSPQLRENLRREKARIKVKKVSKRAAPHASQRPRKRFQTVTPV